MTSDIKTTRGARCTAGGFRGCWSSVDAQNHGGGLVLFREVNIKGVVLPEKVVDKNTREALTRWNSCRGLTTAVAESHSIRVRRLTNYDKHWTGIGQCCDSKSSVPETLLHGIIKRLSQIKYPMCERSQINLLYYQSQFRNNSSSNCCKPTFEPAKIDRWSRQPVGPNCMGRPSNFLTALEAVTCQFQQSTPSNRKYTTFIRMRHLK